MMTDNNSDTNSKAGSAVHSHDCNEERAKFSDFDQWEQCNGCNTKLSEFQQWYTCTECPYSSFCEVCPNCFEKNHHQEHEAHMSLYTPPPIKCRTFCDACGNVFKHQDQIIYRCITCKINNENYDLCKRCYLKKRHHKHIKTFDQLRFVDIRK